MAKKIRQVRELRIILDTNALFTQTANDLVNSETASMIKANGAHPNLNVSWYLPEMVVEERAFQMRDKASSLLPSIEKVERLLGFKLAISKDTLEHQVQLAVKHQLSDLGIKVIQLDVDVVNWKALISTAQKREPPFESGDKEKGFRDAIILETFIQLVENSPRTPALCRVVLVTADGLLAMATQKRIAEFNNVQVLLGLDELKNLINTLSSQVDESFVNDLQPKANALFFSGPENKDTLYYKGLIYDRINNEFSTQLKELPEGAEIREADGINIIPPRFVKKDGQRIYWVTRLRFKAKAYRMESGSVQLNDGMRGLLNASPTPDQPIKTSINRLADLLTSYQPKEKKLFKTGSTIFEVEWAVTIDAKGKLSRPDIVEIIFSETVWE